jgi:hypothetical protein
VITPRANRSSLREYDRPLYGARHLIENFFAKIKQLRSSVTRRLSADPNRTSKFPVRQ